jgi:hypothetical protein
MLLDASGCCPQMPTTRKGRSRIISTSPTSRPRSCASFQVTTVSARLLGAGTRPAASSTPLGGSNSRPGMSERVPKKASGLIRIVTICSSCSSR